LRAGVGKKGVAMGERKLDGDAQPEASAGAGVGLEGTDVAGVAGIGEVEAWVTTGAWEAAAQATSGTGEVTAWATSGAWEAAMWATFGAGEAAT
jgi:hypothetical protein